MAFIIFSFVFLTAGLLFGFLPIVGPIPLGIGVESFLWELHKKDPRGSLTMDGRFFFAMTVLGLVINAFVFYESAPGMALYELVPGMMVTQVIVFVFAFAISRSNRS